MFSQGLSPPTGLEPRIGGGPPTTGALPGGTELGDCGGGTAGVCVGGTLGVASPGWFWASAVTAARNDKAALSGLSMMGSSFGAGAAA